MGDAPSFEYKLHGCTLFAIHGVKPPSDDEWATYMDAARAMEREVKGDLSKAGILVFTDGANPNVAQRDAVNKWLNGRNIRVAVVTYSSLIRTVASALNWFNKHIRVFAPADLEEAMLHVNLPVAEHAAAMKEIHDMSERLNGVKTVRHALDRSIAKAS